MKIVFFGSPEAALPSLEKLLESGHSVEMVITQPEKAAGRGLKTAPSAVKKFAVSRGIPVLEPQKIRTDLTVPQRLKQIEPDINIVVAYGQIIPASIIYLPVHKTLNVHFSLLPKYRGAAPVQWAILNGETKTGVTIMELNEKMDEGDILRTAETEILPNENAHELEKRLAVIGASLLGKTLQEINEIKRIPQDHSQATYAPKIKKEDGRINWSDQGLDIERRIRAFACRPGAFTFFRGQRLTILAGSLEGHEPDRPSSSPGAIVAWSKKGISVACGSGIFTIEVLRPEARNKMSAHAFAIGARIGSGDYFD